MTASSNPPHLPSDEIAEHNTVLSPTHSKHLLLQQPSLRLLASSQRIKLAFCPDVQHLRSYLSTYQRPDLACKTLLAILNPIELHRPTAAFSAQGFNRSLSLAVEAASRTSSWLMICESLPGQTDTIQAEAGNLESAGETGSQGLSRPSISNPWDEEVSILNVTTKSFGAGGRGWVGRTVTVRRVAERWCVFEQCSPASSSP